MTARKIGRYVIQSVLGKGSMGVVYTAYDPQLDRTVAVKTIPLPENLNPYLRDRHTQSLLNEARLAARLNHPGIVKVHDAGEHEGEPYIVLEKVEGRTLTSLIEEQAPMLPDAAFTMMGKILQAMAYAHDQGLVHRDLKPANIMVQPDGQVRVMDFGIAFRVGDAAQTGRVAGTPRYMSPEQVAGRQVDIRSDVFALGAILYELLSGKRPFAQDELGQLYHAIRELPHTPLQSVRPNLAPGLYSMINKALAKRPEDRFPSARQMLEALVTSQAEQKESTNPATEASRKEIVDFILQRIGRQGDFPTTMQYISAITEAARQANSSAHTIAEAVLKDFALTNRILRMVNSPFYNASRRSISTISRALVILGVDAVLDVAAGLSIFEHFHNRCNIPKLKAQTMRSLMTAFHAREIARQVGYENPEEAFICGMMHHLGRLIVAFYFPEEYASIEQMVNPGGMDENAAARNVMRIGYAELGEAIARSWHFPDMVFKCSRGLADAANLRGGLRTPEQMLQGVVSMASELSKATMITDDMLRQAAQAAVARQFERILDLSVGQLNRITEYSIRNAWDISHNLRVNLKDLGVADSLLATAQRADAGDGRECPSQGLVDPPDDTSAPCEEPEELRQDFLIKTIGEITMALMGPYQLNDVLMMVLEGMFRGVGSQHVLLGLVNPARTQLVYRFGLGPATDPIRAAFQFPLTAGGGLPARCVLDGHEIFIEDLAADERRRTMPAELIALLQAKSLLLLPITVRELPIGLFLLDRPPERPPFTKRDLTNLRTLANQAVLAILHAQARR